MRQSPPPFAFDLNDSDFEAVPSDFSYLEDEEEEELSFLSSDGLESVDAAPDLDDSDAVTEAECDSMKGQPSVADFALQTPRNPPPLLGKGKAPKTGIAHPKGQKRKLVFQISPSPSPEPRETTNDKEGGTLPCRT